MTHKVTKVVCYAYFYYQLLCLDQCRPEVLWRQAGAPSVLAFIPIPSHPSNSKKSLQLQLHSSPSPPLSYTITNPSTMSDTIPTSITPLSEHNYQTWKRDISALLRAKSLWRIVSGQSTCPANRALHGYRKPAGYAGRVRHGSGSGS